MDDDRLDLGALDPRRDPVEWQAFVGSVLAAAGPRLPAAASAFFGPFLPRSWVPGVLAVAAAVAVLSLGSLLWPPATASGSAEFTGVVEALGLDAPVAAWLEEGRRPTTDDLLASIEGGPDSTLR